jgi:amidohydrolase
MTERIKKLAMELLPELTGIRRHLHANPELSFKEFNTSAYISGKLTEYGIPHKTGIIGTGITALITGEKPASSGKPVSKKTIALRADMDALPIQEKNITSYCSVNPGVMHACGHDVHSTCLLGAANILNKLKSNFEGSIKLIFQPGEELLPGGASLMIKAGVLENPPPSLIIAQHVQPNMEVGKVGFRSGMYMASTDEIYMTIKGKGGHAAMPDTYINPLMIASEILYTLEKEFMSQRGDRPFALHNNVPTVLAFGKITGNGATNVIPDEVKIEGTFRTMDEKWRKEAQQKIKEIAENISIKMGGGCEVNISDGYPYLSNDQQTTSNARQTAIDYLGRDQVEDLDIRMTGEDFSFYTHHLPACFYRLGTGNKSKGITSNVHTATFDIDEQALETGSGLMAAIALNLLSVVENPLTAS